LVTVYVKRALSAFVTPTLNTWTGNSGRCACRDVTAIGERVVVVRVFVKKTQKTPDAEIDLALQRAKEVQ
jgi:hypothetical protein